MYFNNMEELKKWVFFHKNDNFDGGSQGECFKVGDKVYKIFIPYIEEDYFENIRYDREDIMRFSSIFNHTYIWPNDVIMVDDIVVGYITDYVEAKPLCLNLDEFEKSLQRVQEDIGIISNNGVRTFDVMYNILYGREGFKVIDSIEYSKSDMNSMDLFKINSKNFYYEIKLFLTYGYFDDFIFNNNYLYKMFYDSEVSFGDFLKEFRKVLSENEGTKITRLGDAKKSMLVKKKNDQHYIRDFCR